MNGHVRRDEGNWIDTLLIPLVDLLGTIEELENLTFEVKRMEYIQDDDLSSQVWEFFINIANDVRTIMEFQPNVLKKHESIEWKKLVKVGELLNDGGAALCCAQSIFSPFFSELYIALRENYLQLGRDFSKFQEISNLK